MEQAWPGRIILHEQRPQRREADRNHAGADRNGGFRKLIKRDLVGLAMPGKGS